MKKKQQPILSIYLSLFVPEQTIQLYSKEKNSGTGRTRLTALTAAIRNGKMKTKVVTTSSLLASKTDNLHNRLACIT